MRVTQTHPMDASFNLHMGDSYDNILIRQVEAANIFSSTALLRNNIHSLRGPPENDNATLSLPTSV